MHANAAGQVATQKAATSTVGNKRADDSDRPDALLELIQTPFDVKANLDKPLIYGCGATRVD